MQSYGNKYILVLINVTLKITLRAIKLKKTN